MSMSYISFLSSWTDSFVAAGVPPVYYYLGRAQEELKSEAARDSYEAFLIIKEKTDGDWVVEDAPQHLSSL